MEVTVDAGQSVVFVGANGGGKTRLGVLIEEELTAGGGHAHRIAAQRALQISRDFQLIGYEAAEAKLLYGVDALASPHIQPGQYAQFRVDRRWQSRPATSQLNDYEALVQALFADDTRCSVQYRQSMASGVPTAIPITRMDRLKKIWRALLPHRELVSLEASLTVKSGESGAADYPASELSDGERVIFYLVGQSLLARVGTVLIVDEPELHIHRGIMPKLWDAIEAERTDCGFIYLTHDLEFAASRTGAETFALRNYVGHPTPRWDIERLPVGTGFPEELVSRIAGSRAPVLFVEGDNGSLDAAVYRRVYPNWTVIPTGGCERVIHSVQSLRAHPELHRALCAGIVDRDARTSSEVAVLAAGGVYSLPVSEVENLFLLPSVFSALAETLHYSKQQADDLTRELGNVVLATATNDRVAYAVRQVKRRIDGALKRIGIGATDLDGLQRQLSEAVAKVSPSAMHEEALSELDAAIGTGDPAEVLAIYDNKGLLAEGAKLLSMTRKGLDQHLSRVLRSEAGKAFRAALAGHLPELTVETARAP